jgi:hypothetical protein
MATARPATLVGLRDDFARAAGEAGGAVDLFLSVAARTLRILFAGGAVAHALGPAFAHLEAPEHTPALTLHVWDRAAPPTFALNGGIEVEATTSGPGPSYYYESLNFRALHQPATDALSVLNAEAEVGWFWVPDATALPYWDYTAPFRHLLSWWLAAQGLRHVHAGAVGTEAGGVLLVGPGGAGKSTTALASLLDERLRYAGDDYVAVGFEHEPTVHSLYGAGKLHRDDVRRFPALSGALEDDGRRDQKAVFYIEQVFPGRSIPGFPLRAIVLPRVTDRRAPRVLPGTQAAALSALAPSTIFQLHPPAPTALSQMAELVRSVPTFVLELGTDIEAIPAEILRLLEELG